MAVIHFDERYKTALVKGFEKASETDSLFDHSLDMEFSGVKTVHVKSLITEPLQDYNRNIPVFAPAGDGGAISMSRYGATKEIGNEEQTFTMTQDKSLSLSVDKGNNKEVMDKHKVGEIMAAERDEHIIPYVDTYRLKKWAENAGLYYELPAEPTSENIVEQVIRPTGLLDPLVSVRPVEGQIDDLMEEIRIRTEREERVLVTTLTKKMAEDLTDYLDGNGIKVRYLHHDVDTMERMQIIRDLRLGVFDVLVGINLLREGLDLPEVSLVAILDADKEGFLRSETSLIQTIGRAARNAEGKVILYADKITASMEAALTETERRRTIQMAYNLEHNIIPKTIEKKIAGLIKISADGTVEDTDGNVKKKRGRKKADAAPVTGESKASELERLREEMQQAAKELRFEEAAYLRDRINELRK